MSDVLSRLGGKRPVIYYTDGGSLSGNMRSSTQRACREELLPLPAKSVYPHDVIVCSDNFKSSPHRLWSFTLQPPTKVMTSILFVYVIDMFLQ